MNIVVGLGNIGDKYQDNRHNVGFMVLDAYANKNDISFTEKKIFHAQIARYENLFLVKPETYMNDSGLAAKKVTREYLYPLVVVYDDIDINLGEIKISFGKNSGGHNGVQSVIDHLGTKDFLRVRVGVRPVHEELKKNILPPTGFQDFLLSDFTPFEQDLLGVGIDKALAVLNDLQKDTFEQVMNKHN